MLPDLQSLPVFDEDSALEMIGGERDFLMELLDAFRETLTEYLDELQAAMTKSDTHAITCAAHAIKGSAANICAERIRAVAAAMEECARDGNLDYMDEMYESLVAEVERFGTEVSAS